MSTAVAKQRVKRFWLQPTATFAEGAPQRESYAGAAAYDRACVKYAAEWRAMYRCSGCDDVACPQCGAEGESP